MRQADTLFWTCSTLIIWEFGIKFKVLVNLRVSEGSRDYIASGNNILFTAA